MVVTFTRPTNRYVSDPLTEEKSIFYSFSATIHAKRSVRSDKKNDVVFDEILGKLISDNPGEGEGGRSGTTSLLIYSQFLLRTIIGPLGQAVYFPRPPSIHGQQIMGFFMSEMMEP